VLDATINGGDDDFFVLVDGEEVDFDEITTSTHRTLTIAFPVGAEEIEIIGTFVVPEFGTIAAMILAVAIISIIAISAKSRLSIIPRY
jgi:predicted secreted protein with PEFG-CTERM motif